MISDMLLISMFLRCHKRLKDGKEHRYYSIEESRRLQSGRVVQRRVLYLGSFAPQGLDYFRVAAKASQ